MVRLACVVPSAVPLIAVALVLSGCTKDQSRSPTAPTLVAPPPAPSGPWSLTKIFTSITGPDICFVQNSRRNVGIQSTWSLSITRSATTVSFLVDDDIFLELMGTVEGGDFAARSVSQPINFPACPDGTELRGTFETSLTGRFSEDGRRVTATETRSYHFSVGEVRSVSDWKGSAP